MTKVAVMTAEPYQIKLIWDILQKRYDQSLIYVLSVSWYCRMDIGTVRITYEHFDYIHEY